jgi:flagellar motility protein MotE (MotC chaperone)
MARLEELTRKYCASHRDALEQARMNWQRAELEALDQRVKQSIEQLDKKIEALQALRKEIAVVKSDAIRRVAAIVAEMRPDAAAQQISAMDQAAAASVLTDLPPKVASQILNEMPPKLAAQLTQSMTNGMIRGQPSSAAAK